MQCKLCKVKLAYHRTTSLMINHLRIISPDAFLFGLRPKTDEFVNISILSISSLHNMSRLVLTSVVVFIFLFIDRSNESFCSHSGKTPWVVDRLITLFKEQISDSLWILRNRVFSVFDFGPVVLKRADNSVNFRFLRLNLIL